MGIVSVLITYLNHPLHLDCASALINDEERKLCLELLKQKDTSKIRPWRRNSEISEAEEESEADEEDQEYEELLESDALATLNSVNPAESNSLKDAEVKHILYVLCRRILRLTFHILEANTENQHVFRKEGGLNRLYELLNDVALRGRALRVIATVAIGSPSATQAESTEPSGYDNSTLLRGLNVDIRINRKFSDSRNCEDIGSSIIRDIVGVLQSSGGTSTINNEVNIFQQKC